MMVAASAIIGATATAQAPAARPITPGEVRVIDGDTMRVSGKKHDALLSPKS